MLGGCVCGYGWIWMCADFILLYIYNFFFLSLSRTNLFVENAKEKVIKYFFFAFLKINIYVSWGKNISLIFGGNCLWWINMRFMLLLWNKSKCLTWGGCWRFDSTKRKGAAVEGGTLRQGILEADYRVWKQSNMLSHVAVVTGCATTWIWKTTYGAQGHFAF